jgi:hypothetical protein
MSSSLPSFFLRFGAPEGAPPDVDRLSWAFVYTIRCRDCQGDNMAPVLFLSIPHANSNGIASGMNDSDLDILHDDVTLRLPSFSCSELFFYRHDQI